MKSLLIAVITVMPALAAAQQPVGAWRIAAEYPTFPGPQFREPSTAEQLIAQLDEAGIRYGALLSSAYWHGSPLMIRSNVGSVSIQDG